MISLPKAYLLPLKKKKKATATKLLSQGMVIK